jgi:hypothetical protein
MELLDKQMNKESEKFLVVTIVVVIVSGLIGIAEMTLDSYATIVLRQAQEPSENTTGRPGLQFQRQPLEAPEDDSESERQAKAREELSNAAEPEDDSKSQRQAQAEEELSNAAEQQENANDAELKDEQIIDEQQQDDGNNDEEQVEIDKAPVVISGDNVFIVWFNDQNTPNNNSEVLFRSSTDGGVTFADKINLSNTTAADSINAEIAADGNNVVITWWERNATGEEPVVRASADNGATFGPMLTLATNGTIGQATE